MEQKCSLKDKVISLHLQRCSGYCPNASSCYHMKKDIDSNRNIEEEASIISACVESGAKVYYSVCMYHLQHYYWLEKNVNYNVTLSCDILRSNSELKKFKNQLQVTVYTIQDIEEFKDYQKLFLIKDQKSWISFSTWLGKDTGRLHFLVDQDIISSSLLQAVIQDFNDYASEGQTLDSCLTSYLVNGECPYENNNYIDITFDGTVRHCPYTRKGTIMSSFNNILPLFTIETPVMDCKYKKYFGGKLDEEIS